MPAPSKPLTPAEVSAFSDLSSTVTDLAEEVANIPSGGSSIQRATGILQAYTDSGSPATAPPSFNYTFDPSLSPGRSLSVNVVVNSTPYDVEFGISDPVSSGESAWVDSSALNTANDYAQAFWATIQGLDSSLSKVSDDGNGNLVIATSTTGSASNLSGSISAGGSGGGGNGTDEVPPSGNISSVTLAAPVTGKTIKIIAAWFEGTIDPANFALFASGSQISEAESAYGCDTLHPALGSLAGWFAGVSSGGDLTVQFTTDPSTLPTNGATCAVSVLFEQS